MENSTNTKRVMTVKEILRDVCERLSEINVPAAKIEEIGIPIAQSIAGIKICVEAIERDEKKEALEDDIQVSEVEAVDEIPEDAEPLTLQ